MHQEGSRRQFACMICAGTRFWNEKGKIGGLHGLSSHQVTLLMCEECGHVHLFDKGRSWWNVDAQGSP
jgi:uncharacterized protein